MAEEADNTQQSRPADSDNSQSRLRYKSYRKKYRKMRLNFDDKMDEANALFLAESQAADIAQRIQEQNDQILEILLEIGGAHASGHHRRHSSRSSKFPRLEDVEKAATHTVFGLVEDSTLPIDLRQEKNLPLPGYFAPAHEEQYLGALDAALKSMQDGQSLPTESDSRLPMLTFPRSQSKRKTAESEYLAQNPVSVQNWLYSHHPQMFDGKEAGKGDRDKDSDRGSARSPAPPVRAKKKERHVPQQDKQFEALDDEIGFDAGAEDGIVVSASKKRKKDDDAYRPKGGGTRVKTAKRKRDSLDADDGRTSGKKLKKNGEVIGQPDHDDFGASVA